MITGAHLLINSKDADADRAFFRDVLEFRNVDAGHGWLIFALPPAEAAFHPAEKNSADLYFLCDDLDATVKALKAKQVKCGGIEKERWGTRTSIQLPSGAELGLYQPSHKTAI
jgi:hypothetical protein